MIGNDAGYTTELANPAAVATASALQMIRFFRHYIPLSLALLTGAELVLFFLIAQYTGIQYGHPGADGSPESAYKPWLFAMLLSLLNSMFGLYDWEWTTGLKTC